MFKFLRNFAAIYLFAISLLVMGCPISPHTVDKAQSESKKVAAAANAGVEITRALFNAGKINKDLKNKIADAFTAVAQGGEAFDAALANIKAQYGNNPPQSAIEQLFGVLDTQVIDRFLTAFATLGVSGLDPGLRAKIEIAKAAILAIAGLFGQKAAATQKLAAVPG